MESSIEELSTAAVAKFKDMVERLKGDELEDYEVYACLAKYVSDNLPRTGTDISKGAHYPAVVSYLDKHGITVTEVLSYVNNDAGQLLANETLAQRFAALMDYFENKGVPAEEVFECLEVFVETNGRSIYNAFGNLTEVDYFNYATVSGYLNSRGIAAESLRQFLEYEIQNESQYVESIRPTHESATHTAGPGMGLAEVLKAAEDEQASSKKINGSLGGYGDNNFETESAWDRMQQMHAAGSSASSKADIFTLPQEPESNGGYEEDSSTPELHQPPHSRSMLYNDSPPASGARLEAVEHHDEEDMEYMPKSIMQQPNGFTDLGDWHKQQQDVLKADQEALQALTHVRQKVLPAEMSDLRDENEELRRRCEKLELQAEKLQIVLDKNDMFHMRLAHDMDSALSAVRRGDYKEFNSIRETLRQLAQKHDSLDELHMYKFSEEEVEGLKDKLRKLHQQLSAPSSSKLPRKKERQLLTFQDFLESLEEAEAEVSQMRDENQNTMKQLVLKKVELAEAQEEVTKTKRALIRAVNKQMQLAYKIDEMRQMYLSAVARQQQQQRFPNRMMNRSGPPPEVQQ